MSDAVEKPTAVRERDMDAFSPMHALFEKLPEEKLREIYEGLVRLGR